MERKQFLIVKNGNMRDYTDLLHLVILNNLEDSNSEFINFILSGNGETSFYKLEELKQIKELIEKSNIFDDYRIHTSGNIFNETEKLELFNNWIKELTVISSKEKEDQNFYDYKVAYMKLKSFLETSRIRVNIVVTNKNHLKINDYIEDFSKKNSVETMTLRILDNSNNSSIESKWVEEHTFKHNRINKLLELITEENKFITFKDK